MKRRLVNLNSQNRLLDLVSFGKAGRQAARGEPARSLSARRGGVGPEVMVKVSGGARSLRGVASHLAYVGRKGSLPMESDMGEQLAGRGFQHNVVTDWDLDLETAPSNRWVNPPKQSPKIVHNLIFSMPPGTPPAKVLMAVKKLAQEEWSLKHRYAFVLHTDEPHPHVHVVLKARSEQGERLNIRKATLRNWREQFASTLREFGVAAQANHHAREGRVPRRPSSQAYRVIQRDVLAQVASQSRHPNTQEIRTR